MDCFGVLINKFELAYAFPCPWVGHVEHFLVHGLDTDKTSFKVVLSMETKVFTSSFTWTSMPLLFGELTNVTSPRPENFFIHGLFVDLNKSNMEIRDSHNIMYIT